MKTSKIQLILLLLGIFGLSGCESNDGIGKFDGVVIESANNPNKFRQVTFLISLHDQTNGYLIK